MKKLFVFLVLTLSLLTVTAYPQDNSLTYKTEDLTPEQLNVIKQLKAAEKSKSLSMENLTPDKIDKYAQMGKGLGIAINEGLGAVTKNVEQFAQTSAGKWLMVLITWKVMGEDAVGLVRNAIQWSIGGFLILVGVPVWIWVVKRNCVNRPIAKVEQTGFWTKNITYSERLPIHEEYLWGYVLFFFIYLAAVAMITFVH